MFCCKENLFWKEFSMKDASLIQCLCLLPVDEAVYFTVTNKCTQKPVKLFVTIKKKKKVYLVLSLTHNDVDTL